MSQLACEEGHAEETEDDQDEQEEDSDVEHLRQRLEDGLHEHTQAADALHRAQGPEGLHETDGADPWQIATRELLEKSHYDDDEIEPVPA